MSSRTTLKTYFLKGASPTEAQFSDLIDSTLIIDSDLVDNFSSTSTVNALTANAGKVLNDSLVSLDARVVILEGASTNYLSNYYTKSEVDSSITSVNTAIDGKVSTSTFNTLSSSVSSITSSLSGKSDTGHSHVMSDITDLQPALDAKTTQTYVDNTKVYLEGLIGAIDPGGNYTSEISALDVRITSIESQSYATTAQLSAKASASHVHSLSDISDLDLSLYYDKTQVDVLLSNVVPKPHTHIENDITDLDKYTRAQTDLKFTDHNNLTNNPHNVTKAQVSLGNVENLSVADLFATPQAQAFATDAELQTASLASNTHISSTLNPHNVTKAQVSLGNVPNINFQSLLDAHLNASNPHNINLTYFDVYSRAETDTRVQHYIDTLRYAYTPSSPTDSSGSVGDFAYDLSNLYFKASATNWITLSGGGSSGAITGTSLNIGSGLFEVTSGVSASTDIDTPNLAIADNLVLLNKNQTGTPLSTLEGGLEIERGSFQNAKVYWQESTSKWKCNLGGQVKTIVFEEDINPLTSTTDLSANVIAAPTSWGSNKPTASFSYTVTGSMVTVQWYLDGNNGTVPLTALNNDQIYYALPNAIAFNEVNSSHIIRVSMSVRTGMTTTNATAFGDAFVNIHNSTTRIGMRFWGINNVTSSGSWSVTGQVTYPI